jgi:hypothetical protein
MMTLTSEVKFDGFFSTLHLELHDVGSEQHQGGQTGGTDGIALGDGLGGVADGIQGIGDGTDALVHFGHFGNTTGVVGDGAVGVDGDDHTGHGKHGHGGHGDAVEAGKFVGQQMARQMARTGNAVACMETARPAMMLVP